MTNANTPVSKTTAHQAPLQLKVQALQPGEIAAANALGQQVLQPGTRTKVQVRAGASYKVVQKSPAVEQPDTLAEQVVVTRQGDDLHLRYAGDTELVLEGFYPACSQGQCAAIVPSAEPAGVALSGSGATSSVTGSNAQLVYAYGESAELRAVLQSQGLPSSGAGFTETATHLSYTPQDHGGILPWAMGLGGIALLAQHKDAAPDPTVIQGNVVAGPVLSGNGLHATAYRADGTVLVSGTVNADGGFTLTITDGYTGPVLVRVYDTSASADYMDEATGAPKDLSSDLRAATHLPSPGTYNVSVNVLTELAVRSLGLAGGDNGNSGTTLGAAITATQVSNANAAVASAVGLTQDLVLGNAPVAVVTTTATLNAAMNNYGKLLAALSGAELGSSTDAVLTTLAANLNAHDQVLSLLVDGAAKVTNVPGISANALIQSVSDLSNKVSTTVINAVSTDNVISATERVQGITISGTAQANASVTVNWGSTSQNGSNHTVTADNTGAWSATFSRTEIPLNGATVITANSGTAATATRSVFVEAGTADLVLLRDYDGTTTAPTPANYLTAGIEGVTPATLYLANSALAVLPDTVTDTVAKLQAVANAASALLALADGNSNNGTALSAAQFTTLGVTGLNGSNSAVNAATASLLSSVLDGTSSTNADSLAEIQILADASSAAVAAASGGSISLAQLQALGLTGATSANLANIQAALAATADNGTGVDTLAELRDLVTAAVLLDTLAPTVTSVTTTHTSLKAGETATIGITLSEAATNFTVNDLEVVGGTLSNFVGTGSSYSVTFTPDDNRTDGGSVSVKTGSFTDAAGNVSLASNDSAVVMGLQTVRPSATLVARQSTLGVGDATTIDITLSEASNNFTLADLAPSHGTLSSFTALGDGIHYSVVFTPDASYTGTGGVSLASGNFSNAAGNTNSAASTNDLAIDTTPPTVTITSDVAALAIGQTAHITFTFNKDPGASFDASDIAVNGGTLSKLTNHTGTVWSALFTPTDGSSGQASITVAAGAYADSAGNKGTAGATPSLSIDTQGPEALLSPANATTVLPGKALVLSFDEAVHKSTGSIVLVNDTDGTRTSFAMSDSAVVLSNGGQTLTITPSVTLVAGKQYHVEATPGSLLDAAGNAWGGIASSSTWAGSAWHFTAATPSVSLNAISADNLVSGTDNTAGVVISGTIDSNTTGMVADFVAADFSVTLTPQGGGATITSTASSYNTTTGAWSLMLASGALVDGKTYDVSVAVTGSSASGPAHGATAITSGSVVVDLSAAAPTLALVSDTGSNNSDGITTHADVHISGLEADATWQYKVDIEANWHTGSGDTVTASLADGAHTVTVRQTDKAGNISADATLSFTLDATADRPVINAVTSDEKINASEVGSAITGTAEAGASVKLVLGSGEQARTVTTTADGSGNWSHTFNSADLAALGEGQTQITAVQTDAAGNVSFKTLHNLTVDTAAPTVSITAASTALNAANGTTLLTFTLSEASSDFTSSSVTVSGGALSNFTGSGTSYTATFTPTSTSTTAGSVSVAAGAFHDAAGNANAQASETLALSIDQVLPTVAISSSATTLGVGQTATITFTLSEAKTDFAASSITTVGGTLGALSSNATGTVYTAIFTPTEGQTNASVSVASGAVHDAGGNANTDGSDANNSVAITMAAPSALTISSDKTSLKAGETATLTFAFSSAPTGFAASDITVTGGTLSAFTNVDSTHYTATFTPTASAASGSATVSVIDGSFTGAGGSTGQGDKLASITFDTLAPSLLSTTPDDGDQMNVSGATLVATFTEEVFAGSGNLRLVDDSNNSLSQTFAITDSTVTVSGNTLTLAPTTALVAGHNYHVEIASTALVDKAGNAYAGIANATSWNFSTRSTPVITLDANTPASDGWINADEEAAAVVLSGVVTASPTVLAALTASDITVKINRDLAVDFTLPSSAITYDNTTGRWSATVDRTFVSGLTTYQTFGNGRVNDTLDISVTGGNTSTTPLKIDLTDPTAPTLTLASDSGTSNSDAITNNGTVNVGGLEAGATWQYSLDNGTTWQTGAGSSFALTQDGATTVQVIERDAAGNASSLVSKAITLDSQADKPVINAIAGDNLINASETTSTISGTAEAGATLSISLGGNTRTVTANGSGLWSYTLQAADITAMGQGSETINVTQTDKAGNTSAVSSSLVQLDTVLPTVTLANTGSATLKAGETTTITATLSEASSSFSASSLTVSGGTLSELKADSTGLIYTGTFTPDADSTTAGSIQAAIGAVSDAAGNTNSAASNALAISVNTVRPTVAITSSVASSTTLHAGDNATLTFTLSQGSSDFTASDVTVVGGTLSNWSATSATVYTATFTPDANSTAPGSVSVASGTFSNAATNTNADGADANNAVAFQIATARPSLSISSDVGSLASGQSAVITFSFSEDPGTSFTWNGTSGDVTITGGTLGALSGSGTKYTAIFTPTAGFNGAASITVADGSYTNAAGSTGHAGTTPSITIDTATPTVAITRSGAGNLVAGQTDTITFTFSEAPGESFTLADVAVSGGTLGALSAVSATQYVAVFTPDTSVSQTAQISVASKTFTDTAGNLNADGADANNALAISITNAAQASSLSLSLAKDTGASATDGITNNPTIAVRGLSAGTAWEYTLDSSAANPTWVSGSGASFDLPSRGTYAHLAVRLQGNANSVVAMDNIVTYRTIYEGNLTLSLATDSGISSTDHLSNSGVVNVGGLVTGASWRYTFDNGLNWNIGSGNSLTLSGDGSKALTVEATDPAGFSKTIYDYFVLDTTAPNAPNVSLTPAIDDGGAIMTATNGEKGAQLEFRTQLNAGSFSTWSNSYAAPTATGSYVLEVRMTDLAGNVSDSTTLNFTVSAPPISLSAVAAGQGGFVINGQYPKDNSGYSVSSAGDVNGDGLADLIVGAFQSDPTGLINAGCSYVVFAKTNNAAIDLSNVAAGQGGFVINGQKYVDYSGISVSSAGDVNGDGLADLIIGAYLSDPGGVVIDGGRSYVVFGKTTGTAIDLSAVNNGVGGFVINGQYPNDSSGYSVSSAGDVNGDGLVDLIIGAYLSDPAAGLDAGRSYVVFGKTTGTAIDLSNVAAGQGGFVINGQSAEDRSGYSVSSAGDVNGDGLADLIVGANRSDPAAGANAGRSYVVFGKTTGTGINLSAVAAGQGGFVINGQCAADQSGVSVSSAGDVNGDGLADLIVGAFLSGPGTAPGAGRSYVVFGKMDANGIDLSAVAAGQGGFVINGEFQYGYSGVSVSSAGDINGDGLVDLIVGAPNSPVGDSKMAGRSYVVFGKTTGTAIDLSNVAAGKGGFVINAQYAYDYSGFSVSSAGDVNGDGLADLIVGAYMSDPAADLDAGRSYVIFGSTAGVFGAGTKVDWLGSDGNDTQADSGTAKTLVGGAGNDALTATAASVLYGGSGNDTFTINQTMATALQSAFGLGGNVDRLSRIDGGSGTDTLVLSANTALDLTKVADSAAGDPEGSDRVASIERIDLSATGSSLTLSSTEVAHLAGMNSFNSATGWSGLGASVARHQLVIDGAAGSLTANGLWVRAGTATYGGNSYTVYNGDNNTQLLLGSARTLPVPPVELSAIAAGVGGFVINGQGAGDWSGYSVSSAGDVNGDGLDDLIVGAHGANSMAGRSYVVFGKTNNAAIDLSNVAAGNGGFVINGQCTEDFSGYSVSSAGDVNGDGLADLIVGSPYKSDPVTGASVGYSFVVFGKTTGSAINLSAVAAGTGGFAVKGQCLGDASGISVSSAGDVNGDGLADLIVGAYLSDPAAGLDAGRSYVVFGKTTGSTINLSAVAAGTGGFAINGQCAYDLSGVSVSSAGDVNGDGLNDLIVGAEESDPATGTDAGRSYVVFGKTSGTAINLSAVAAGQGGFVINGQCEYDYSGSVSSAGDVNGDGMADLIVGAPYSDPVGGDTAGCSYVVFGKTTGTAIDLSAVAAGQGGFVINGQSALDRSGISVSSAGDVNGDGLADLIIGTFKNGQPGGIDAGRSYVVFGKTTGTSIDLSAVAAGQGGFVINGQSAEDRSGFSVSSAGDVNGDGLADLIVGAYCSDPAAGANAGRSYVIFGSTSGTFMPSTTVQMGTTGNDALSDGGTAQLLVGNGGNDTLTATAASVLRGGNGSDTFVVNQTMVTALQTAYGQAGNNGDYNASIDGGHGGINSTAAFGPTNVPSIDTLRLSGSSIALDLTQVSNVGHLDPKVNSRISGIEVIDLNGATNTLKLTAKDVLDISDAVDLSAISGKADYRQLVVRDSSFTGTGPITGRGPAVQVDLADGTGITPWVKANATVTGTNWGDATYKYVVYSNDSAHAMVLVQLGIVVA